MHVSFQCLLFATFFLKCRNQRLVVKRLQVSGSIRTRMVIFIIFFSLFIFLSFLNVHFKPNKAELLEGICEVKC